MSRRALIAAVLLLIIALAFSLRSNTDSNVKSDIETIQEYVDNQLDHSESQIEQLIQKYSQDQSLEEIDDQLKSIDANISFVITAGDKHLLWKGNTETSDFQQTRILEDGKSLHIGLALFDLEGSLHPLITSKVRLHNNFSVCQKDPCHTLHDDISIQVVSQAPGFKDYVTGVCLFLSFLLFLFFLVINSGPPLRNCAILIIVTWVYLRIGTLLSDSALFILDPSYSLSYSFLSFYDLILFSLSFLLLTTLLESWLQETYTKINRFSFVLAGLFGFLLASVFCLVINEFQSLINSPRLAFNFEEPSQINSKELLGLACIASWNIALFILTQSWIRLINQFSPKVKYIFLAILIIGITILTQLFVELRPSWVLPLFLTIYFVLSDLYFDIRSKSLTWLIWWIIVYAAFTSILLFHFDTNREIRDRVEFLERSYTPFSSNDFERAKNIMDNAIKYGLKEKMVAHPNIGKINTSDFIQLIEKITKDSLRKDIVVEIYGHDENNANIFSGSREFDDSFLKNTNRIAPQWDYNPLTSVYIHQLSFKIDEKKYTSYIGIKLDQKPNSTITYTYDYYQGDSLSTQIDDQLAFPHLELSFEGTNANIMYRPNADSLLVSRKSFSSILKPITLFSLFFCLTICLLIGIAVFDRYYPFLPDSIQLNTIQENSLSVRIQMVVIAIIVLSFIAIAIITSLYLSNQVKQTRNTVLKDKIVSLNHDIQNRIRDTKDANEARQILIASNLILEEIHNIKCSFYSTNGRIYNRVTFAPEHSYPTMPYIAYNHLAIRNNTDPISVHAAIEETYLPVIRSSEPILYASLEMTTQELSARTGIWDFLSTLLNVYVFLFLIASSIAIAMARSITNPVRTLALRMKEIKLGKRNKSIEWQRNDELGLLINNYNDMLLELEESALLLAKTERDGAWREMAKQVAHEIKNPLTPMKLSIQYLSRAIKKNPDQSVEIANKISQTLIEQIDNLSQIASSFSNFGTLPSASNERVVLNEVIETIHDLFRKRDDLDIKMSVPLNDVIVFADKSHLIRVLNNLVKNAIQSIPNSRKGSIEISLYKKNNDAIIRVKDNGIGIPKTMYSKIFTPNFTTKSSGSGLGLAIASNMLEAFNGKLDFDSVEGEGSNFYITIPLMKLDENFERIEL